MSQQAIPRQLLHKGEKVHIFAILAQNNKHICVFYFVLTWVN